LIVGVALDVVVPVLSVRLLLVRVFVLDMVGTVTHSTDITPADTLAIVVSLACHNSTLPTPIAVLVEATNPAIGSPVQLVRVPDDGVPNAGVVNEGDTNGASNSILSYTAFFVGTSRLAFHPAQYASSGTVTSFHILILPVPCASILRSILVSAPVAYRYTTPPAAAVPSIDNPLANAVR
jgi:hypothetical protein